MIQRSPSLGNTEDLSDISETTGRLTKTTTGMCSTPLQYLIVRKKKQENVKISFLYNYCAPLRSHFKTSHFVFYKALQRPKTKKAHGLPSVFLCLETLMRHKYYLKFSLPITMQARTLN